MLSIKMQSILSDLKKLEECWMKKYPTHAQGGVLRLLASVINLIYIF